MARAGLIEVAGATGKTIARALDAKGREYLVIGRNRAALENALGASTGTEITTWDPDDPGSVRAAVRGTDTLVYLVGVPYNRFELLPVLMWRTLEGAMSEDVQQILLIGTVYPYGMPRTTPVKEDHPREHTH